MRGTVPGLSTRLPMGVQLPGLLQDDPLLQRMVSAFDEVLAPVIGVLDDLDAKYSGIKARIVDETGELRRFVNVYVGNDDVRFLDGLATATPDGAKISVIPAVAGG